ncbi:hypothetical protein ACJ5H2_04260 [Nocardioides sp. R1-1]|uniref:hypothetical protein n=1 Tax=Nocardioides sp. R1-1 TaxID=3383502 RepID=UPI0038CFA881
MTRRLTRLATSLGASAVSAVVVITMTTTAAQAGTTFTPSGGPNLTFVGSYDRPGDAPDAGIVPGFLLTDIDIGQSFNCSSVSVAGPVVNSGASRAYHANVAQLSGQAAGCTNPFYGATTVTFLGTWGVTITGDPANGQWPAKLTNVKAKLSAVNCDIYIEGYVVGRFDTTTQVFAPAGNPVAGGATSSAPTGLTIASTPAPPTGSMCATLDFQAGDTIAITGTFTNVPPPGSMPLTLTSP